MILIDGGGNLNEEYDTGKMTILPYLLSHQISQIDLMIISHFDLDHCQGLVYLLDKIPVKQVIIGKQYETSENYEKFSQMIQEKQISVKILGKGDEINLDSHTKLKVLWPTNSFITDNPLNNNAFVFQLLYRNRSILFCGDIEKEAEAEMLKQIKPEVLQADILKVAHHGAKTSSTVAFLDQVNPQIALIGVRSKQSIWASE